MAGFLDCNTSTYPVCSRKMNALDGVTEQEEGAVRHNTLSGTPINVRPNAVKIYLRRSIPYVSHDTRARAVPAHQFAIRRAETLNK